MSVWTDWLDYIPVVGTVKNTVEAVSAVCHGDYALAKEKGADAALGLVLDVLTAGTQHAAGTAYLTVVENIVFRGTTAKEAMNAIKGAGAKSGKGAGAKSGKGAGAKAADATQVPIQEMTKKSSRPKDPKTSKGEKKGPSERGEHVINNNVLKVFKTIIDRFAARIESTADQLLENKNDTAAYRAYHTPLPEATIQSIRYEMVAHIPEEEPYIDANATVYGTAIGEICDMVVTYMYDYSSNNSYSGPAVDKSITELIRLMNNSQLYVDEYAKQYWLRHGGDEAKFQDSRQQVVKMFRRLCAPTSGENEAKQWVRDLTGHW
ncbi:uncharacterized protein LOC124153027 [Haliotis rufescens]|uniref:uncharacterized protein LOC124153027 n=1 Tax=Haliotis rufescens TaxID=6454 RepID=UPI00201E93AB|nr:uncharacterized protein LOC124153027 [Haliotis rufescens]XP_048257235.1 uncharacterized protein LOC124153027 [Haliotis rufescens]XP_048257236.1 uncharacterized protein LOC124153027 [Haliotis rufescens]XP_048257237.1 uncharacterized protein LOC124153027 [Haliotis rufescens]XP_048257238.1 uncharacterized protein LOC124153027 [Haliotis rufescens]